MFDIFLAPNALPFSIALAVTAGLFAVEIISLLLGATVLGLGGEGPDIDVDTDFDLTMDVDLDGPEIDIGGDTTPARLGALDWIGARDVPFLIWLVSFLTMFGLIGLIIQSFAMKLLGTPLFTLLAVMLAVIPALAVTRVIANWVSLIMPKTETSAMRMRFLG